MMYIHDAEYFRQCGRALRITVREPFPASKIPQRTTTLRRLEQMAWPRNQFGEPASIAELVVGAAQLSEQPGENLDDALAR